MQIPEVIEYKLHNIEAILSIALPMEFTFSEWDMWKAWVMYRVNTNISYTHVSIKTIILGSLLEADSTGLGNTLVTEGYLQVRKGNATNNHRQ